MDYGAAFVSQCAKLNAKRPAMSLALFLLTLLASDAAPADPPMPPRLSAAAFDEDDVAGHPDGEPPPLPKNVNWSIEKAQVDATPRRRRLTLAGPWRFAAMSAPDVSPQRGEMGWLKMPAKSPAQWEISDKRQKATQSQWSGKPLGSYPYAWCERVLDTPVDWVNHQVFLVVGGPWAKADLFVAYQPVPGVRRDDGSCWFEITESLVYGGEAPIAMRLKDPGRAETPASMTEAFIGVELLPTGRASTICACARIRSSGSSRYPSICGGQNSFWGCRSGSPRFP